MAAGLKIKPKFVIKYGFAFGNIVLVVIFFYFFGKISCRRKSLNTKGSNIISLNSHNMQNNTFRLT